MLKNVITRSVFSGGAIAKFLAIGLGGSISIDLPQPTTWRFSRVGIDAQEQILLARLLSSQATKSVLASAVLGSGRCFWC